MAQKPQTVRSFLIGATMRLVSLAAKVAKPSVQDASRSMQELMIEVIDKPGLGRLHIPHYWAVFRHDGREFAYPRGTYLIWFRDVSLDPRLPPGRLPITENEVRRLTSGEFKYWTRKNREAIAAGRPPPMIMRRRVGRTEPTNFFSNTGGMAAFPALADKEMRRMFDQFVLQSLGDNLTVNDRAVLRL